jgi:hypothetical protein
MAAHSEQPNGSRLPCSEVSCRIRACSCQCIFGRGKGLRCNSARVRLEHLWFAGVGLSDRLAMHKPYLGDNAGGSLHLFYSPTSFIRAFLGCTTNGITRFTNGGGRLEKEARAGWKGVWADPHAGAAVGVAEEERARQAQQFTPSTRSSPTG